ncbi:MAG: nucleotidyltransferase domain-containing protein [Deltaproteobacteria bacterium]|nr:nucleotidyltransferase domain-containing protein [Deltaproteobacteria bacterium]
MYFYEKKTLERMKERLMSALPGRVVSVFAFGSRVRGDHDRNSDFDILIVVKDRSPAIEERIMDIIVQEEMKRGLSFTPVIKDFIHTDIKSCAWRQCQGYR